MAGQSIKQFVDDRNAVAARISPSSWTGLFGGPGCLPRSTAGLVLFPDGTHAPVPEGGDPPSDMPFAIAKKADIRLSFSMADLQSKDGFPVTVSVVLRLRARTAPPDLFRDLVRTLLPERDILTSADLKEYCTNRLLALLTTHVNQRDAGGLHGHPCQEEIERAIGPDLERFFFATGLQYLGLPAVSCNSPRYEKSVVEKARREEEARLRAEREARREEQIKNLGNLLGNRELRDVLDRIPDERAKGVFYARLMEQDASDRTPRELLERLSDCDEEIVDAVTRAMQGLLSHAPVVDPPRIPATRAGHLYVVLDRKVIELDPAAPNGTARELEFGHPLRSVRVVNDGTRDLILAGSRDRLHLAPLEEKETPPITELLLPIGIDPRGGINAMALHGERVYATHSEAGLLCWDISAPERPANRIFPDLTHNQKTTRAVVVHGDHLFFASGPFAFRIHLASPAGPDRYLTEDDSPITALCRTPDGIFAGTDEGIIYAWSENEPENPRILLRRRDPIVALGLVRLHGIPHLVYGARDLSLRARVLGQTLETSFETDGATVGLVDAASDRLVAVDTIGRRLLFWNPDVPDRPTAMVETFRFSEKPVLDIHLNREVCAP